MEKITNLKFNRTFETEIKSKDSVSIVGFGRFGQTLARLLDGTFDISVFDIDLAKLELVRNTNIKILENEEAIYQSSTIIFCVPISTFPEVIRAHRHLFRPKQTLIDVLSVKTFPKMVFNELVDRDDLNILLTHPMFGPDSTVNGFANQPIVLDQFRTDERTFNHWKDFFHNRGLRTVEMTAEEHDQKAAFSQGIVHFIGRVLNDLGFVPTEIDTVGAKKLFELMDQTCHNTVELFRDLQNYNPNSVVMRQKIETSLEKINRLIEEDK